MGEMTDYMGEPGALRNYCRKVEWNRTEPRGRVEDYVYEGEVGIGLVWARG